MKDGYGAPVIRVFAGEKEIQAKVSQFIYKFSEKEDDTCQMKIVDTYDPNMPDRPEFQEGAILTVMWGYVGGKMSKPRKVAIRDIVPSFDETEVCLEILCTDVASRIKIGAKKKVHNNISVDKLAEQVAKENGLEFKNNVAFYKGYKQPEYFESTGNIVTQVDNTSKPIAGFFKHESYPQANKTDAQVLNDMLDEEPGGPYQLVGRDDELILQRLTLDGPVLKSFIYGGSKGELIKFTPETKSRTKKSKATEVNIFVNDPLNKSYGEASANADSAAVPPMAPIVDGTGRAQETSFLDSWWIQDAKTFLTSGIVGLFAKKTEQITHEQSVADAEDPYNQMEKEKFGISDRDARTRHAVNNLSGKFTQPLPNIDDGTPLPDKDFNEGIVGKNGVVPFRGVTSDSIEEFKTDGFITAPQSSTATTFVRPKYGKTIQGSEDTKEKAAAKAQNKQAKAALEKNPAEAVVVGDPDYISGVLYGFEHVSKKYSGIYYAIESTHTFSTSDGFKVELALFRNGENRSGKGSPNKRPAKKGATTPAKTLPEPTYITLPINLKYTQDKEPALLKKIRELDASQPAPPGFYKIPIIETPAIFTP